MNLKHDLEIGIQAVIEASKAVMRIYQSGLDVSKTYKSDKSPVTEADLASNHMICEILQANTAYPILSEEQKTAEFLLDQKTRWILDPLDGTKEFLAQREEFTINLALVEENTPLIGIVAVPAKQRIYYAIKSQGAYLLQNQKQTKLQVASKANLEKLRVAVSRSHLDAQVTQVMNQLDDCERLSLGSAFKYCAVADGSINTTFRKTPLHVWDVAAADCIVQEAGGMMTNLKGQPFCYHQEKTLIEEGVLVANLALHSMLLPMF
ncbi:MAG: 3'(2'),5'-bisphosphate nucleotidase CysQ [Legionella sp.]|nr:3'(2'),5'-bisphosphate nucleotidase CysQ [Legionella sp.]